MGTVAILLLVGVFLGSPTLAATVYQPSPWASAKIEMAQTTGLLSDDFGSKSYTENMTRQDFCRLLINSYRVFGLPLPQIQSYPFKDTRDENASQAFLLGLTSGTAPGVFSPDLPLTREMAVVMLSRLSTLIQPEYELPNRQAAEQLLEKYIHDNDKLSDWARVSMAAAYSRGIITGTASGILSPQDNVTREQAVILSLNTLDVSRLSEPNFVVIPRESQPGSSLPSRSKTRFSSAAEASVYMKDIEVQVWQLDGNTKKTATLTLTVHRDIAEDIRKIFAEIYSGPERFPIKSCYGYAYRGTSQHSSGLAIDINPAENYFIGRDGRIKTGKLWKPGENPYSIVPGGDVVRAFEKYGWHWSPQMGWSSGKDYMHFSLLGT